MTAVQDVFVVAALRSPIGKAPRGRLAHYRPDDLLAAVIRETMALVPQVAPALIQDLIVGCAIPEGPQGLNVARVAGLLAGLPDSVPGMTVNRFCASGLAAVAIAANRIRVGEIDIALAAGVESMSQVPVMGTNTSFSPAVFAQDETVGLAYGMGATAEEVARRWQVAREDQDAFALRSHQRALAAHAAGSFKDEIMPLEIIERSPDLASGAPLERASTMDADEGPRADTSMEALARLRPVFAAHGSVTAGNSSQTSDGAGVLLLASERALRQYQLQPLARYVTFAVCGVPPKIMGIGPVHAIPAALKSAGLSLEQMGWIELNEAFAAQSLAVIRELGLDEARVNPLGGAIALGHPLGATGAARSATVIHALQRERLEYGMVTMCVGAGMGAAGIYERC